jgi:hypothetical protein
VCGRIQLETNFKESYKKKKQKKNDRKGEIFQESYVPLHLYPTRAATASYRNHHTFFDINFISTGRHHINSKNAVKKHSWASVSAFRHLESQSPSIPETVVIGGHK